MRTPVNGQRWKEAAPVLRFNEKKKKKFLWMHGDSPRAFNMAQATPPRRRAAPDWGRRRRGEARLPGVGGWLFWRPLFRGLRRERSLLLYGNGGGRLVVRRERWLGANEASKLRLNRRGARQSRWSDATKTDCVGGVRTSHKVD